MTVTWKGCIQIDQSQGCWVSEENRSTDQHGCFVRQLHFLACLIMHPTSLPTCSNFTSWKFKRRTVSHCCHICMECNSGLTAGYGTFQSVCCAYTYVLNILYRSGSLGLVGCVQCCAATKQRAANRRTPEQIELITPLPVRVRLVRTWARWDVCHRLYQEPHCPVCPLQKWGQACPGTWSGGIWWWWPV